jgi:Spin-doc zinc-finger/Domain of unknown function (DUF4371)
MAAPRKRNFDGRLFNERWTIDYFFILHNGKLCCLVCQESIAVIKEYNIKRHYDTKHKKKFDCLQDELRLIKVNELRTSLTNQQNCFTNICNQNESTVRASYKVARMIAKCGRPFTDGEFLKNVMIEVMDEVCPEKQHLIKEVSLSARTITRRIEEIGNDVEDMLKGNAINFQYFSIAMDESCDIKDTAQLLIFIRGIDEKFNIFEEMAALCSLKGRTTGEDLFISVQKVISSLGLKLENLKSITTDGGLNMSGQKSGVSARISQRMQELGFETPMIFHCIIHQQALCMKILKLDRFLDVIVPIINFIKRHGLNHRQFQEFLIDIEAQYEDIIYYTDVRWLSKGNMIKRFFLLKDDIYVFMMEKGKEIPELVNSEWLIQLAFLVDITSLMNDLNIKLQGKGKLIHETFSEVKAFEMKLKLLKNNIIEKKLHNLPFCKSFFEKDKITLELPTNLFLEYIESLQNEFSRRFSDFHKHSKEIRLFQNPFAPNIEDVPEYLQLEVIDLQTNDVLKDAFKVVELKEFYAGLSASLFPALKKFSAGMITIFASTYICEQTFSRMNYIKNKHRTRITDGHLHALLRVSTTSFDVDFNKLAKKLQKHQSSH